MLPGDMRLLHGEPIRWKRAALAMGFFAATLKGSGSQLGFCGRPPLRSKYAPSNDRTPRAAATRVCTARNR